MNSSYLLTNGSVAERKDNKQANKEKTMTVLMIKDAEKVQHETHTLVGKPLHLI